MQEEESYEDLVDFISLFDSPEQLEDWESRILPEQSELMEKYKTSDSDDITMKAWQTVFSDDEQFQEENPPHDKEFFDNKNKQFWIEKNQDIVNMILENNKMSIQNFTEEVNTWEPKNVAKELKKLKNCNDMLELIDMYD